jgi:putative membrane protein (TIGR04086 family)
VSRSKGGAAPTPNARLVIDITALRRGIVGGLVIIIPVSVVVALASRHGHTKANFWLVVAFVAILYGYATAGYGAARTRPESPLSHGMLAGLGAFLIWLLVRLVVPLARGDHLGFGVVAVVTNALFAVALGALGGMLAARKGPTAHLSSDEVGDS